MIRDPLSETYARQIQLPEIGIEGQYALAGARVLVIGAGGLGCPALLYLAAAGIGCLGIADHDRISHSNLHRQVLYGSEDVGALKAETAARRLKTMRPSMETVAIPWMINSRNALDVIDGFDIVIDGSDNFPTRYLVSDACALLEKPLIYGSVYRFEGQVGVFNARGQDPITNYRDLFPVPPGSGEVPDCETTGVIGMVPGIIGTWQALEAVKLITGAGEPLVNQVLTIDLLHNRQHLIRISPDPAAQALRPRSPEALMKTDYGAFCGMPSNPFVELDVAAFDAVRMNPRIRIVDVREPYETPHVDAFDHLRIPLRQLPVRAGELLGPEPIIFFCQHGIRSAHAAAWATETFPGVPIYHLKGGILAWQARH